MVPVWRYSNMTTAVAKTPIEAKWSVQKVQEEAARIVAANCLAAHQVLQKYGDQAVKEYQKLARQYKVENLKNAGAKTPFEIAKTMAEVEANVFGSKIVISGDDKSSTLVYNSCGMWNAIKKVGKLTPEQEEQMGEGFQSCMQDFGKEFNLKTDVQFEGQDTCVVTFTK